MGFLCSIRQEKRGSYSLPVKNRNHSIKIIGKVNLSTTKNVIIKINSKNRELDRQFRLLINLYKKNAWLSDFGIAKIDTKDNQTKAGIIKGKFNYENFSNRLKGDTGNPISKGTDETWP